MELPTVLTYLGLLIASYGATQEYVRLKLKLAPLKYKLLFFFSLLILYISTLQFVQHELIIYGTIHFYNGLIWYLWESKYWILLTINLFSLYMIVKASKLTPRNQNQFLELIHELRSYKNYAILHKLIKENLEIIFNLKYNKTFAEKTSLSGYGTAFDELYKKLGVLEDIRQDKNSHYIQKEWNKLKIYIYKKLAKFSYKKDTINEIFQYTISDKQIIQSIIKQNEPLGIEILKQILKHSAFDSKFQNRFLINIFKDTNSYIYKEFIIGGSSSLFDFLNNNQQFEKGFDIGLNISFAILELLEDNTDILNKAYSDYQLDPLFNHINELFNALENTDPNISHYSNLPHIMQRVILKEIDLSSEVETVGFYFLNQLYSVMKELNVKCKGAYIMSFNSLYSGFISNFDNATKNNIIRIGCHYIDYMFNDRYIEDIDLHVKQFKESIQKNMFGDTTKLCEMYLLVLDKQRGRGECEDWIAYTHSRGNNIISKQWDEIMEFLKKEMAK